MIIIKVSKIQSAKNLNYTKTLKEAEHDDTFLLFLLFSRLRQKTGMAASKACNPKLGDLHKEEDPGNVLSRQSR